MTFGVSMIRKRLFLVLLSALLLCPVCARSQAAGIKFNTTGAYTDASGGQHAWSITDSHTLIWDGAPYLPVGGIFASRYISLGATEENYKADTDALQTCKSRGITDVVLKSVAPITSTDAAAWQKMIDYLDANGFTYGIEISDGPREPLKGYLISPNRYRAEGPWAETTITCDWPDVDSAMYVVANKFDNSIKTTGGAITVDAKTTIRLSDPVPSGNTLIIFPHKKFRPVTEGGVGDIWSGFGEYRDRLLTFFKNVKFGPGLRFFLEPLSSKMDFTGEMAGILPDSPGFRLGFEAFLTRRHAHEGAVNAAWGLNENLDSVEVAARLMPMWYSGRGVPYAWDRASGHLYPVDPVVTRMWVDLLDYRDSSAQEYMNSIADALKKQVANVPVIFKSAKYHRIHHNPFGMGGSDGLGTDAYGSGEGPAVRVGGPLYSLAEESGKCTWFVLAGTNTASSKTFIGYPDEASMFASLDSFRDVGCKGFFVDSLQALPEGARANFSIVSDPRQLDWLASFKSRLNPDRTAAFKPTVISFPTEPATGAYVKRLAPGIWWLPTLRTGKTSYIGDSLAAYTISGEDRTYMWSISGPQQVTIKVPPSGFPSVEYPEGVAIQKMKGGSFGLSLWDGPTVLRGIDFTLVFPEETARVEIDRLVDLIPQADKSGMNVQKARAGLESARTVLKNGQPYIAYGIAQTNIAELLRVLGADIWIEAESSPAHNFDGAVPAPGASAALALILDTDQSPPISPYSVLLNVDAQANMSYELWVAGTPPSEGSPMSYSVDDGPWTAVAAADGEQRDYAPGLAWFRLGAANFLPGKHVVKFRVDGRRQQDNRYYYALDAIVLSPRGFKPNGVIKPH